MKSGLVAWEPHGVEEFDRARHGLGAGDAGLNRGQLLYDLLANRDRRIEHRAGIVADVAELPTPEALDLSPVEAQKIAAPIENQALPHLERRVGGADGEARKHRLARSRLSDDAENLLLVEIEGDMPQDGPALAPSHEIDAHILNLEDRRNHLA